MRLLAFNTKRIVLAGAFAVALALLFRPAGAPAGVLETAYRSHALAGRVHVAVYLPPGYATSGERYPVVYFLHGLPASPTAYRGIAFLTGTLDRLRQQAILVAPQGARAGDSDPEYLDWGPGRNWETAIARELPRYVDTHYRTIPRRAGRALVGLSAGGYGAAVVGLHHLDTFAVVESWSGYFHATDPTGTRPLDRGTAEANADASAHALLARLQRRPTFFGFYVGRDDTRFRDENVRLHAELTEAHIPHLFRLYSGGHEQALWSAHASVWLRLALTHLAPARRGPNTP